MAKRVRVKKRFFVFLIAVVLTVGGIGVLIAKGGNAGVIKQGSMSVSMDATAVIIRDEMCVSTDRYDRVNYLAREGSRVTEGENLARVYKWGYSDDMMQQLLTVEGQIYSAQKALVAGIENTELAAIEIQIENKRSDIRNVISNGTGAELLQLQNELSDLLVSRAEYLKTSVQPTSALEALYATELERQNQIGIYRVDVAAAESGIVSFYFDGYEQVLNCDKLDTINVSLISTVASGTSAAGGEDTPENLIYRTVNPNKWYLAFVTPKNQGLRLYSGERYDITVDGYENESYSGIAMNTQVADAGVLNLLEITDDIGWHYLDRNLKIHLSTAMDGFLLPSKYIGVNDGTAYVVIEGDDEDYSVAVDVLATDDDMSLVRAKNTGEGLSNGMRYKKP